MRILRQPLYTGVRLYLYLELQRDNVFVVVFLQRKVTRMISIITGMSGKFQTNRARTFLVMRTRQLLFCAWLFPTKISTNARYNHGHHPWKFEANWARTFWVTRFFIKRPLLCAGYAIFFKQLRCNQMLHTTQLFCVLYFATKLFTNVFTPTRNSPENFRQIEQEQFELRSSAWNEARSWVELILFGDN